MTGVASALWKIPSCLDVFSEDLECAHCQNRIYRGDSSADVPDIGDIARNAKTTITVVIVENETLLTEKVTRRRSHRSTREVGIATAPAANLKGRDR